MYEYIYDYEECRKKFYTFENVLKKYYSTVENESYLVMEESYIDSFLCENPGNKKLFLITTGEHGIEGFAGNIFLQIFINEFLPRIKNQEISLLLIHALNPWGMKNKRRVNENNVDLNRNFLYENDYHSKDLRNEPYEKMRKYFTKNRAVKIFDTNLIFSLLQLLPYILQLGPRGVEEALTKGQYIDDKSIYYGGNREEKSTEYMKRVFKTVFKKYEFILHLDIHTGAGQKDRLLIVNSAFDKEDVNVRSKQFNYSPITQAKKETFYSINGDMIDYIYKKYRNNSNFYSTCLEYGTYGKGLIGQILSIKALVLENQAWWYGTENSKVKAGVDKLFREMFFPKRSEWRKAFEKDTNKALNGILKYFEFLK
ncbi:MAG: DUF2817 domain-containing protein [Caldisericaceae bacterium]